LAKDKDKENNSEIKFTSRSELVLIPVLVTDKSGNHITGLKKDDFVVFENGSERQVSTFEEIASDPHPFTRPGNANQFSNSLGEVGSHRRVTLIVLDLINTPFADQAYARKELLKYLAQSVDQREPTGLYTLNRSGVHVVHDFTTDPRVLVAALHKVKGDTSQMVNAPEDLKPSPDRRAPRAVLAWTQGRCKVKPTDSRL
jgi:VWFA-related protein